MVHPLPNRGPSPSPPIPPIPTRHIVEVVEAVVLGNRAELAKVNAFERFVRQWPHVAVVDPLSGIKVRIVCIFVICIVLRLTRC
jgi:hypothetical protein